MKTKFLPLLVLVVALHPGPAFSQVEALLNFLSVVPHVGSLVNPNSVDASRGILVLTTPAKNFVGDVKTVAHELGYQVEAVGTPGGKLSVLLVRQSSNIGAAVIGKDWRVRANLSLQDDGRTIEITTGLTGNDVKNSGTAQDAVDKIKAELEKVTAK